MCTYTNAFALGYYYGRTFPADANLELQEQDMALYNNAGFASGFERGQIDFQEIDLPKIALSMTEIA